MGVIKKLAYLSLAGALAGGVVGSQHDSIPEAYKYILEKDYNGKVERTLDYLKDGYESGKIYAPEFKKEYGKLNNETEKAKEKLEKYEKLPEGKQTVRAITDIKNFGLTFKEADFDIPKNKGDWQETGKGATRGAGAGAGLGILASILGRRKKKNLESKFSIFLGVLLGGVGISMISSNLSNNITGNVIGNLSQTSGIVGIILLLTGILGTYFYFRKFSQKKNKKYEIVLLKKKKK
jgi:hypothetical protein